MSDTCLGCVNIVAVSTQFQISNHSSSLSVLDKNSIEKSNRVTWTSVIRDFHSQRYEKPSLVI